MTDVAEVMSEPLLTIEPDEDLRAAAHAMHEAAIGSVAVVDDDCEPDGILTTTDFVELAADAVDPTERTVADAATDDVITVSPDTPVGAAAERMLDAGVHHLPVADDGELLGIVTSSDLADHLGSRIAARKAAASDGESDAPEPATDGAGTADADAE